MRKELEHIGIHITDESWPIVEGIFKHEKSCEYFQKILLRKSPKEILHNTINCYGIKFFAKDLKIHLHRELYYVKYESSFSRTFPIMGVRYIYKIRNRKSGEASKIKVSPEKSAASLEIISLTNSIYWGEFPAGILSDWFDDNKNRLTIWSC